MKYSLRKKNTVSGKSNLDYEAYFMPTNHVLSGALP
jgi:hypothetical protein